jgi:anionic cell wall polymer biosynthesis LytR-Cps2A-Psr (LCP) family protein
VSADAVPDIDRISRQQDFIRRLGLLAVAKSRNNPLTANNVADRVLENLTVDSGFSRDDVLSLVDTFIGISPNDTKHVQFETIPWSEGPSQQGQSVLYLREPAASGIVAQLGGTGIGTNPSLPNASATATSGVSSQPIANQNVLGSPARRTPPC